MIQQLGSACWVITRGVVCMTISGRTWWPTRAAAEAALSTLEA